MPKAALPFETGEAAFFQAAVAGIYDQFNGEKRFIAVGRARG